MATRIPRTFTVERSRPAEFTLTPSELVFLMNSYIDVSSCSTYRDTNEDTEKSGRYHSSEEPDMNSTDTRLAIWDFEEYLFDFVEEEVALKIIKGRRRLVDRLLKNGLLEKVIDTVDCETLDVAKFGSKRQCVFSEDLKDIYRQMLKLIGGSENTYNNASEWSRLQHNCDCRINGNGYLTGPDGRDAEGIKRAEPNLKNPENVLGVD